MNVLVMGGTRFIGKHLVQQLLDAGHQVTLVNRGLTDPHAFPEVPRITADRDADSLKDVKALDRDWDAVVDLVSYFPNGVEILLEKLEGRIGRYLLCSTVSVYASMNEDGVSASNHEDDAILPCSEKERTDPAPSAYGQRKAEIERITRRHMRDHGLVATMLRPSVVYGEHDHTDRFGYWIDRAASNSPFILPDGGTFTTRRTYAPDLARAFVMCLTHPKAPGRVFNIADDASLNQRETLENMGAHQGTTPLEKAVSIPTKFLLAEGLRPWADLPLWVPGKNILLDTNRIQSELGFQYTPISKSLAESSDAFLKKKAPPIAGISHDKEAEILMKWKKESST